MFNVNIYFHHVPLNWVSLILPQVVLFQICDVSFHTLPFHHECLIMNSGYFVELICSTEMSFISKVLFLGVKSF